MRVWKVSQGRFYSMQFAIVCADSKQEAIQLAFDDSLSFSKRGGPVEVEELELTRGVIATFYEGA